MEITQEEKNILLSAARNSIKSLFAEIELKQPDFEKHPLLKSNSGAFVTLTKNHRLRGCIGYVLGFKPLYETVCDAAIQAAKNDPRFPSLSKDEFDDIEIEISILSEPFPMNKYEDIEIGKHGLIMDEPNGRGLLLPQVPIEHNMDRNEFLTALCQKSGLPGNYWREKNLKINMFTATVFSEMEAL